MTDTPDTGRQARNVPTAGHAEAASNRSATGRLLRALAVMASGTMLSKILGFGRVALAAYVIGNGTRQADMWAVATTVPTALYILFAGGALNSVLVPQLTRAAKHDPDGGESYTNRIITAFLLILLVVTLVVTVAAPAVTALYSADTWRAPGLEAHYRSMVLLTMVCLPEIFFYGMFVVLGQVLNARDRFGPMMWAPIASNLIQVGSFVAFLVLWGKSAGSDPFTGWQIAVLGGGYLVGMVLQAAVMVWCLRKVGYHYRPRFDLKGTGLGKTFKLAGWAVGFVLVNQLALIVVSRLATSATAGGSGAGLTVYNNAYLVFLLPHSLITVSLATAMVTSASKLAAAGDLTGTAQEVMRTMRLVATALVPAAVLLVALAHPLANLLFGHGTGAEDAGYIGWTITAFAVGLVPFTIQHICLRTYYALEQNRATFLLQVAIAAVQIVVAVALVVPFDNPAWVAPALALAFSVAYLFGVLISFRLLRALLAALNGAAVVRHIVRVFLAVLPGAVIAWLLAGWLDDSTPLRLAGLAAGGMIAVGGYLVGARLLHISEINQIVSRLRGRRDSSADGSAASEPGTGGNGAGVAGGERDKADPDADAEALMETRIRPAARQGGDPYPPTAVYPAHPAELTDPGQAVAPYEPEDPDTEDTEEILESDEDTADETHPIRVKPGRVIGDRYQLEQILVRRPRTQTWRALDRVLSRPVLIHLLPHGEDDRVLLATAKKAAVATDSRFLRVLDAEPAAEPGGDTGDGGAAADDESPLGAYIVCEYAPGQTLERLLADGPLSALEAAWLVREVADGLAGMHEQRLYHERINPDTVVITVTGNVKIVGFLLESEFGPTRHPLSVGSDPLSVDVSDLGRLLYCTLVSRWPGGPGFGMAAAPVDVEGHLLTPRQVRAGVSPALDSICDRILSPVPRQRETRLRTAHDVVRALNQVLGTADAAHDLERRLRYPVPVVDVDDAEPPVTMTGAPPASASSSPIPGTPYVDPDAPTGPIPMRPLELEAPTGPMAPVTATTPAEAYPTRSARAPGDAIRPEPRRRWIPALILLTVLVLVASLVAVWLVRGSGERPPAAGSLQPLTIARAADFDPQGSDRSENPQDVPLAFDDDPQTAWHTVPYRTANLSGKDGTGIMFDLGSVREIGRADLLLAGDGTSVELRIPTAEPEGLTEAPMGSLTQWRPVAATDAAPARVTLTPQEPVRTRYVIVLLTELPADGATFRGGIADAAFWGK